MWTGSCEHLDWVVGVSWRHWMPDFPSIPLAGGGPPHPRCQRSEWKRRSRSGRPPETGRCPSRCRDLNIDGLASVKNESSDSISAKVGKWRTDLRKMSTLPSKCSLVSWKSDVWSLRAMCAWLLLNPSSLRRWKQFSSLTQSVTQHTDSSFLLSGFLTGGQMARSSAGSSHSAWCRSATRWIRRRGGGTTSRPCSSCCIYSSGIGGKRQAEKHVIKIRCRVISDVKNITGNLLFLQFFCTDAKKQTWIREKKLIFLKFIL